MAAVDPALALSFLKSNTFQFQVFKGFWLYLQEPSILRLLSIEHDLVFK
jgi:hypothetical protein